MISKKKVKPQTLPYGHNPHITVESSMKHGRDEIVVGTQIRFKNDRGVYKFIQLVHNAEKQVSWIDCIDAKHGGFKSFYLDRLKGIVKAKRRKISV